MKVKFVKALKDKRRCTHTNTKPSTHLHLQFYLPAYFNKHASFLLVLTPIPQMLCPAALQQRLIFLLSAVYTMHALVELIEVSQAHHSEMGAMRCAVCQPVIHV